MTFSIITAAVIVGIIFAPIVAIAFCYLAIFIPYMVFALVRKLFR